MAEPSPEPKAKAEAEAEAEAELRFAAELLFFLAPRHRRGSARVACDVYWRGAHSARLEAIVREASAASEASGVGNKSRAPGAG